MAYTNKSGIKIANEKETLSDGTKADNVMIRWDGGVIKIAAESQEQAERLFMALAEASYIDITTWESSSAASLRKRA